MRPVIWAVMLVFFFGELADPFQSQSGKDSHLKINGEQLPLIIECYKDVAKTVSHYPAASFLAADMIYLLNYVLDLPAGENWRDSDVEKLRGLHVKLMWDKDDARLADQKLQESIKTNQAHSLEDVEEMLELERQKYEAELAAAMEAVQRATKNGWKKVAP